MAASERCRLETPLSIARSVGAGSVSSRASSSIYSCVPFSARDPRAFPLAGASKEHERLHRRIHDDAAGQRLSWWLTQRQKSKDYVKSRGLVVGGPSVVDHIPADPEDPVPQRLTKAFEGAAGRRTSKIKEPEPFVPKDPAFEHTKQGLKLEDLAGLETRRGNTMREILEDRSGAINAADVAASQPHPTASRRDRSDASQRRSRARGTVPAGRKCHGSKPKAEGLKVHPSGQVALIDQLICGHDISKSPEKLKEHLGRQEFDGAAGKKCLGEQKRSEGLRTNVAHATFSQVDEVVFGHDMDFSISRTLEHLEDSNFHGAAGQRSVGRVEGPSGLKLSPAKTIAHADTVIMGRDLANSREKVKEHLHRKEFKDAAGSHSLGQVPRREGLKANFVPGTSQVDEIVFGESVPAGEMDHLLPENFEGAAGRRYIGQGQAHVTGVKPSVMGHVTRVDKIAFGRAESADRERLKDHLEAPQWSGAAGRKCIGVEGKPEGRQTVLGSGLSQVDEIVWGHDIDRSNEKIRLKELARLQAIGAIASAR